MNLKIVLSGKWTFYTPCNEDGSSELHSFLEGLSSEYNADVSGLIAKLQAAAGDFQGPKVFNEKICHFIDDTNRIFQIRHRQLRLLMFYSQEERRAIICATPFIKRTNKTPSAEITNANAIKRQYEMAVNNGRIVILPDEED